MSGSALSESTSCSSRSRSLFERSATPPPNMSPDEFAEVPLLDEIVPTVPTGPGARRTTAMVSPPVTSTAAAAATRQSSRRVRGRATADRRAVPSRTAAAMRVVSTAGDVRSACRIVRRSSSSAAHSAHSATCCSTPARESASNRPCSRSGSRSRMSPRGQSFIEKLLDGSHRVVVVHPGRALRALQHLRNLLVRQPLRHPEGEYVPLHRRQPLHRIAHPTLRLVRDHLVERVVLRDAVVILDRHALALPSPASYPVADQVAGDREEPRLERAFGAEAIQRGERSHERVLHDLLELRALAQARDEPPDRYGMTLDEERGRVFIARAPSRDQSAVTRLVGLQRRFGHSRAK